MKIKIVNKTKRYLKNVDYHLFITKTSTATGDLYRTPRYTYDEEICFKNTVKVIEPYKKPKISKAQGNAQSINTNYAILLRIPNEYKIEECLQDKNIQLCFEFSAQDEYREASAVMSYCYGADDIVCGKFELGASTNIIRGS